MDMQYRLSKTAVLGAIVVSAAWGSQALANQWDDIKARGAIVCGTQNASSTYGFKDPAKREYVGYDVDMCKAIAKAMGLKMQSKRVAPAARITATRGRG